MVNNDLSIENQLLQQTIQELNSNIQFLTGEFDNSKKQCENISSDQQKQVETMNSEIQ